MSDEAHGFNTLYDQWMDQRDEWAADQDRLHGDDHPLRTPGPEHGNCRAHGRYLIEGWDGSCPDCLNEYRYAPRGAEYRD